MHIDLSSNHKFCEIFNYHKKKVSIGSGNVMAWLPTDVKP